LREYVPVEILKFSNFDRDIYRFSKLLIICSILYSDVEILDVACGIGVMGEELRAAGYSKVSRAAGYSQVSRETRQAR
jgi:hypothetical protein